MGKRDLHTDFEKLKLEANPHRRGRALERLVAAMFEEAGYEVRLNARSATPRQTDLAAMKGRDRYLIEVKWTKKPAGVGAVDALKARLRRTDREVRGLLMSVGGLTAGALRAIEGERKMSIDVITGEELGALMYAPGRLPHALRRKHRELFFNGKILIGEASLAWPEPSPGELARSEVSIVRPDGERSTSIAFAGGFDSCLFSTELADVNWVPTAGPALAADVPLPMRSAERLADLLKGFAALGWMNRPHWVIKQQSIAWCGFGAREFVEAMADQERRYERLEQVHHTEQAIYYDTFDGGSYTVALDVSATEHRMISHCNLSLQLEGMPFDTQPLNQLLEFCEVERSVYSRPMAGPALERRFFEAGAQVDVTPSAFVVAPGGFPGDPDSVAEEEWAIGVVVENPFWRRAGSAQAAPEWWPDEASSPSHLVCSLRHHHPLGAPRDRYVLEACQWTRTSDEIVVRPIVVW